MLIKQCDDKQAALDELERLLALAQQRGSQTQISAIKKELYIMRAGIKGERESAYLIDFEIGKSPNFAIIHDLRLEVDGRVAQIDHLLIHRSMYFYVLETKHFNTGLKIDDDGEFLRWNDYKKRYESMASPIKQNERHVQVLRDLLKTLPMPTRLGIVIKPTFDPIVLINPTARLQRSTKFDSSQVVKSDTLMDKIRADVSAFRAVSMMPKIVSSETIEELAKELIKHHKPITIDYENKFGLNDDKEFKPTEDYTPNTNQASVSANSHQQCSKCGSKNVQINSGRYGYYFKCADCNGNTAIKFDCGNEGHKMVLRKQKHNFYKECEKCGSSELFFTNSNS